MMSNTFKVGKFTCEMTLSPHLTAEWSPKIPKRLSAMDLHEYHAGRNALLAEFAKAFGLELVATNDSLVVSDTSQTKTQEPKESSQGRDPTND